MPSTYLATTPRIAAYDCIWSETASLPLFTASCVPPAWIIAELFFLPGAACWDWSGCAGWGGKGMTDIQVGRRRSSKEKREDEYECRLMHDVSVRRLLERMTCFLGGLRFGWEKKLWPDEDYIDPIIDTQIESHLTNADASSRQNTKLWNNTVLGPARFEIT